MTPRARIRIAIAGTAGIVLAALSVVVYAQVRHDRLRDLDDTLRARAATLAGFVDFDGGYEVDFDPVPPPHVAEGLVSWELRTPEGQGLRSSGAATGARAWRGRLPIDADDPADTHEVDVAVSADTAPIDADLRRLQLVLAVAAAVLTGLAMLAGDVVSRRIVDLADHERLKDAFARQARFTADASHELRTPLAVLRTEAEVALRRERTPEEYRASLTTTLEAVLRMQGVVDALLALARADHPVGEPLDLADIARTAAAAEADPRVVIDTPHPAPMRGDARQLGLLVRNLIANARRHTPPDGQIHVSITGDDPRVLTVRDTGEGIPAEALPRLFERFARVDAHRGRDHGGAGLGLSLVRAIARAHGGDATITSAVGHGTCVVVCLPRR